MALGRLPTPLMFRGEGWPPSPDDSSFQGFRWGRERTMPEQYQQIWGGSWGLGVPLEPVFWFVRRVYRVASPSTLLRWPGLRKGLSASSSKQSVSALLFLCDPDPMRMHQRN